MRSHRPHDDFAEFYTTAAETRHLAPPLHCSSPATVIRVNSYLWLLLFGRTGPSPVCFSACVCVCVCVGGGMLPFSAGARRSLKGRRHPHLPPHSHHYTLLTTQRGGVDKMPPPPNTHTHTYTHA